MSTPEVTPESLRAHADWMHGDAVSCDKDTLAAFEAMKLLLAKADRLEREQQRRQSAAAVLAAHGTPTLTPVGEHSAQGVRGLLPVVVGGDGWWHDARGVSLVFGGSAIYGILADPRPDGAA